MRYPFCYTHVLLGVLLITPNVYSQVTVVEAGADSRQSTAAGSNTQATVTRQQATPANATSALFAQIQLLQDEVMQLRGMIEEQGHKLRRLEQQRLDDYVSIDKRITEMQKNGVAASGSKAPVAAIAPALNATAVAPKASAQSEKEAYIAAYQQVKNQDFDQAKKDFQAFLEKFPDGAFAPNAHYWLGELYLLEPDLQKASASFKYLLDHYPKHRKVPDAMFKLAKVYHLQGQDKESKALLKKVIAEYGDSGSSAVKLAKDYLAKNFK